MKKTINFSIYGDNPKYLIGMIKNIELAKELFPDWVVRICYNNTVPQFTLDHYKSYDNVELIDMSETWKLPGMVWRFLPFDSDVFIVRDSDSRLSKRDLSAVNEWLDSGKTLHILRDHPHHNHKILGGMWGFKLDGKFNFEDEINKYFTESEYALGQRMLDMNFLREVVYNTYANNSMVHDSLFDIDSHAQRFSVPMDDYKFIGEIFDENDNRSWEYKKWINLEEK